MHIIAVANQKGGAGKTTTALNLACGLAARGKRVLAIDMDGQCSLSFLLGMENDRLQETERNVYAVLRGKQPLSACIVQTGSVDLIPAAPALYEADMTISQIGKEYRLRDALKGITDYDYVIIDTPPIGTVIDAAILSRFADGAAMVVESEGTGRRMFKRAKEQMDRTGVRFLGVILNKVNMTKGGYYNSYYSYNRYSKYGKYSDDEYYRREGDAKAT